MARLRLAVTGLAMLSIWLSALAGWLALVAMALLAALTATRLRREAARAPVCLRIADDGRWMVLLVPLRRPVLLARCRVEVRSGLAWVRARGADGRRHAWVWWPDTVDAGGLRKLRLASRGPSAHSAAALATMPG